MATVVTNLMVIDVQKSVDFYRDKLGFEVVTRVRVEGEVLGDGEPDQPIVFAGLKFGDGELMLQERSNFADEAPGIEPDQSPAATISLYLRVDNLAELETCLADKVVKPQTVTWYGMKEIWALDPDGYLITVGQAEAAAAP